MPLCHEMSVTSEHVVGPGLDNKKHLLKPAISYYYTSHPINHILQDFSRYVTPACQLLRAIHTEGETIRSVIKATDGYAAFPTVACNVLDDLGFNFIEKVT